MTIVVYAPSLHMLYIVSQLAVNDTVLWVHVREYFRYGPNQTADIALPILCTVQNKVVVGEEVHVYLKSQYSSSTAFRQRYRKGLVKNLAKPKPKPQSDS